jgi:hypothetical protein
MADAPEIMLQLNHRLATSPMPTMERKLRPRLTQMDNTTTAPRRTPLVTHSRATGPVSEEWLQQNLLPRLSRRPYSTHRYFQQRMNADATTEAMAIAPAPVPRPNPQKTFQPVPQLSDCQDFCANLNKRALAGDNSTALHEYRKRLTDLTSESLRWPPPQASTVASGTTYLPSALSEHLSPGSTVENTEEEHKAAVELCFSSRRLSSVKKRDNNLPYGCSDERSDERSSKRICSTSVARRHSEELGGVVATAVEFENQDEINFVRPHESPSRSSFHTEDHHSSHTDASPGCLVKSASAEAHFEESEQHGQNNVVPGLRLLSFISEPIDFVVQTLTNSPLPSSCMRKSIGEGKPDQWETRPMTSDQTLEKRPNSQCTDIRLSQVIKCKGAFLDPHQIWCHVPGSWEDAIAFSEDMRSGIAEQLAH